ncbi:MAG: GNAT family N-acetyltransferase [Chitinophagaceae bacterium]|nr:MAG: GNAT family N-acetyltransferase [Chitinophagaceae bacterium]
MNSVLDNPIWKALSGTDLSKNIGFTNCAYFDEEVAPFIGLANWDKESQKNLIDRVPINRSWFLLIADEVDFIDELKMTYSTTLYQFVCPKLGPAPFSKTDTEIVPLHAAHIDEMIALTELTKPGPFRSRTIEFGNYHGIFENNKLVAMGGERLHVDDYIEVSAICTHPDFQGKGYGAKITHYLSASVIEKNKIPFLHVRMENDAAIAVYKKLGFEIRAKINFYIIKKK